MNTTYWVVDEKADDLLNQPFIQAAAKLIQENELVAFPTETVYGLGGNALSDQAILKIYEAKGRPSDNPLIVHVASLNQLEQLILKKTKDSEALMEAFWPGPLTIVFPAKEEVSSYVTAGLSTVAVRMPDHPIAQALINAADKPIAAPSANLSGKPSPTTAKHVVADLQGKIAGILDGGPTGVGVESTVVECNDEGVTILRPGGITEEMLLKAVPRVNWDPSLLNDQLKPKAPGMKYKHYAPRAPLYIVQGQAQRLQNIVNQKKHEGFSVGVLTTIEYEIYYDADCVIACGSRNQLETVAQNLYQVLRQFDEAQVDFILSESFPQKGIGQAIMNRLLKAAGGKVID